MAYHSWPAVHRHSTWYAEPRDQGHDGAEAIDNTAESAGLASRRTPDVTALIDQVRPAVRAVGERGDR